MNNLVIRREVQANTLKNIYDICNRIFKNDDCFYTNEEIEQEKTNGNNIFLKRGVKENYGRNEYLSANECYI